MPSFAHRVADVALEPAELDPSQVLAGDPRAAHRVLGTSADGRVVRGVWSCTPGVVTDVEEDEMFVVVAGRATIAFADGPHLDVGPGDVCVLERGAETVWTVHETLVKAYQVTRPG